MGLLLECGTVKPSKSSDVPDADALSTITGISLIAFFEPQVQLVVWMALSVMASVSLSKLVRPTASSFPW